MLGWVNMLKCVSALCISKIVWANRNKAVILLPLLLNINTLPKLGQPQQSAHDDSVTLTERISVNECIQPWLGFNPTVGSVYKVFLWCQSWHIGFMKLVYKGSSWLFSWLFSDNLCYRYQRIVAVDPDWKETWNRGHNCTCLTENLS